ncbi:hypothetical protein SF1_12820 [Sphingobacterium faecium NBRC 15299]|uniref:alpha/beta hydrolase n=1 Tax=Sphingobacterium faecium TaxID=34087 RepID=UPI000D34C29F|nr:alpha/beta hydrolase [Sphingobacterium faecium]PTX11932.1 pimeloyl-ACP methyl ester carboxylesterase [Sphingobacterium faecium]GEM63300.1 hypothetical protein SF1_12820 [Sphingobacterium faecium NBRC 15299]
MNSSHIYILSGLGVDRRVFSRINFEGLPIEYLDWMYPVAQESMASYAKRLSLKITAKDPILIGLSFGGMMAIEIAKIIKVQKIVLLASAKGTEEIPILYRIIGGLKLNHILPNALLKKHNILLDYFFGITLKQDKLMLKQILRDTDPQFLVWAIDKILNWKNEIISADLIHIHGSKDRIIPIKNITPSYVIEHGGHFMTMTHAKDIELLLRKLLIKHS